MKTQTQVTQLVFNTISLNWTLYFHIRGCNTTINITAQEAQSFLESVKQDDTDRITIEVSKDNNSIYYIIN